MALWLPPSPPPGPPRPRRPRPHVPHAPLLAPRTPQETPPAAPASPPCIALLPPQEQPMNLRAARLSLISSLASIHPPPPVVLANLEFARACLGRTARAAPAGPGAPRRPHSPARRAPRKTATFKTAVHRECGFFISHNFNRLQRNGPPLELDAPPPVTTLRVRPPCAAISHQGARRARKTVQTST
jgi:hypothetical protein